MSETPSIEIEEKTDSAEISVNAKGDYAFKVKSYAEDVTRAVERTVAAAIKMKTQIDALKG